jgi:hypothetical protein
MSEFLIGVGVLLAVIGPLLLVPVTWLLYRFALRPFFGSKMQAAALAVVLVLAALALTYFPGKRAFDARCAEQASPVVSEQVDVDGFFRTSLFPYEAVLYLTQEKFEFVEAPDPYRDGVMMRYSLAPNGEVRQDAITEPRSRYAVRNTYGLQGGVSSSEKVIYELGTDRELARARELTYQGGPLAIFLGTFGMASCPDIRTAEGSKDFKIFYDLESYVLQAKPLP